VADNIYGGTYQSTKERAMVSDSKVKEVETSELKKTGMFDIYRNK